ncbi:hypothetical protein SAMN05216249_11349 [Acetitomaculum ruminis DSM 5522]|uniref:DUF6273 domain-containing protein n=1 Tax=Acetitomaculum ruminis DSM 5522 TaxID=1120918 RepID=A0A1I0Z9M7_9FIRM|nr:DUF6273 domain-containing protein [Acetitomaculum ruminis]SFB21118.1 hypothetical protein SAMN05216249_11349 [Acetitomaculum ruminis DSM 5522]
MAEIYIDGKKKILEELRGEDCKETALSFLNFSAKNLKISNNFISVTNLNKTALFSNSQNEMEIEKLLKILKSWCLYYHEFLAKKLIESGNINALRLLIFIINNQNEIWINNNYSDEIFMMYVIDCYIDMALKSRKSAIVVWLLDYKNKNFSKKEWEEERFSKLQDKLELRKKSLTERFSYFEIDDFSFNKRKIETIKEGSLIEFGAYYYDRNFLIKPLKFIVLEKNSNKALIISKDILSFNIYNEDILNNEWRNSFIRKWLNDTFYNKAFSKEEKMFIKTTDLEVSINPKTNVSNGLPTKDKVFLLDVLEAEKYQKKGLLSFGNVNEFAYFEDKTLNKNSNNSFWLRSLGFSKTNACTLKSDGSINYQGDYAKSKNAIRPAMWIRI